MKHIVCYSGGHSSALVALEVAAQVGTRNMILVNHDIHPNVEDADIKRFKREVAEHLKLPITFVNHKDASMDQFDVSVAARAFKVKMAGGVQVEICTSRLKTEPFMTWLNANFPEKDVVIYYGFDVNEAHRIQRRSGIMGPLGWKTAYPLANPSPGIIKNTSEIGVEPPLGYSQFKHANCIGCLKAGWQHWYIVYCTRPDIWEKAKWAENEISHAIHYDNGAPVYLEDMEEEFAIMKCQGVPQTEHIPQQRFWADAKKWIKIASEPSLLPCECST